LKAVFEDEERGGHVLGNGLTGLFQGFSREILTIERVTLLLPRA
jgi:hypothetical protein